MKNVLLYIMLESKIATVLSLVDCAEHLLDTGEDCPRQKWTAYKKFQFVAPSTWLKKFCFTTRVPKCEERLHFKDVKDGHIWQKFASQGLLLSSIFSYISLPGAN